MKSALTTTGFIDLLKSRKLTLEDEENAKKLLLHNNYYRLSGYWRKYQINPDKDENDFVNGITFEKIFEIYDLDTKLRCLLQKGLGIFEICFRSVFAYHAANAEECGMFSYLEQNTYTDKISKNEKPEDLLAAIKKELGRSNEKYLTHYRNINEKVPIWAAVEVLSFGTISKMYSRWTNKNVLKEIGKSFRILKDYEHTAKILRSLVNLRNLCAHQSRIWNRRLIFQVPDRDDLQVFGKSEERAQWRIISILMLLVDEINQNNEYSNEILELCRQNSEFYKGLTEPTL